MKTLTSRLFCALTTLVITLAGTCVDAAGFQHGFAADPDGKPLEIGIWYPSQATVQPLVMGPTTMSVAVNGIAQGKALPLVVMSHGTGSSYLGHFDTAIALADAGFVVVAVTHAGDNYADQSRSADVMDRPRQISRVIDHMLSTWEGHAMIDPARIGMYGFSAGGFTTLVSIGGIPDFSTVGPMCRQYPGDFACQLIAKSGSNLAVPLTSATARAADPRIKAAVVAAPALGFTFSPDGLKNVKVPVQLWRADNDLLVPHPRYAEAVRLALPQTPDYHVVANAGHYDFLAPCGTALASMVPAICTSAAGFDRAAFHASFKAAVVSFLNTALGPRPGT
ncbi:MAG: putative lipoprotein signal peptide [Ramlibacter sp.]|nr:putative lipoprotein signal peptide [Ramlibacter sp.]